MAWFKVDDGLHGHPKPRRAGLAAMGLWALSGSYTSAYGLDGFVPEHYVMSWPSGKKLAAQLVAARLWVVAVDEDQGPGWGFHDFGNYNPLAVEVAAERAAARDRQRKSRARRRDAETGQLGSVTPLKAGDTQ